MNSTAAEASGNSNKRFNVLTHFGGFDWAMTEAQAIARVCELTCADYCGGPEADRDEDGKEVWFFGCVENGTEVYIKIRLDPNKNKPFSMPVIRSFHPAEHPLSYQLKGGGK